jgi:hypothetical protein
MNALCDALFKCGIDSIETPATPDRIWNAIKAEAARATSNFLRAQFDTVGLHAQHSFVGKF